MFILKSNRRFPRSCNCRLGRAAIHQRQDPLSFRAVIERAETSDFIEATHPVQRVEIMCVACRKLACLEITTAQVLVAKRVRALTCEKMKAQPATIGS